MKRWFKNLFRSKATKKYVAKAVDEGNRKLILLFNGIVKDMLSTMYATSGLESLKEEDYKAIYMACARARLGITNDDAN